MMKARMLALLSLALGTASVALAQAPVQLKFSRVVDLTLPIESNMAPIPGLKPYLDNPSRVNVVSSITEAQREALRAEGMTLSSDHQVNGRSMISVLSILVHNGTHIDAPRHMVEKGISVDHASRWWPCHSPSKVGTQVRYAWSLWWNKPRRPLASKFDLVVNLTTAKARGRTVP